MNTTFTRQQLREIIIQYGRVICEDSARCRALLQHYAPAAKREANILIHALQARVAVELLTAAVDEPFTRLALRLTHRLQDELAMTPEAARWSVLTWAYALGVASEADLGEAETGLGGPPAEMPQVAEPEPRRSWWQRLSASVRRAPPPTPEPTVMPPATVAFTSAPVLAPADSLTFTLSAGVRLKLQRIPTGAFVMGSHDLNPNMISDEAPQHQVVLNEYYIGRYPVTNAQYAAFVRAMNYPPPVPWVEGVVPAGKEQHPITAVTWHDAEAFCQWAGAKLRLTPWTVRLPTEAEWEKAARGMDGRTYPWGGEWNAGQANVKENTHGDTLPVGFYSPQSDSVFGVGDMSGNVWEWCADWYAEDEYRLRVSANRLENPRGPQVGSQRVARGTSFLGDADTARCAFRFHYAPTLKSPRLSFRMVLATTQWVAETPLLEGAVG